MRSILPKECYTGGDWSFVNSRLGHNIGLINYPKIVHWDTVENDFEFAYITPISLPGTNVQYLSEMHIGRGRNIISGPELLEAGIGFTLRSHEADFWIDGMNY